MVQEAIQIEKLEADGYILTFDVSQFSEEVDGHKWSLLIKSHSKNEAINLGGVVHDPESDFYSATAPSIEPLRKVASIIQLLTSDKKLMDIAADKIDGKYHDEDDMSIEEWLQLMEEAGFDMNTPRKTSFLFSTLQDKTLTKRIEKELENYGYKTEVDIFEGDFLIEAQTTMKPQLSEIYKVEEKFKAMALNFGAIYITCEIEESI